MKNDLISIVVPVYNVEKYIKKCVNSIMKQTYHNLEILLINDGSTDNSGEICQDLQKKDNRIKVFNKENEGLGYTRNYGIEKAKGKYISFIDSDDFIKDNYIELLYNSMKNNNVDIVYCGHNKYYDENHVYEELNYYKNEYIKKEDIFRKIIIEMIGSMPNIREDKRVSMSACEAMYSLELIKNKKIKFESERKYISEDLIFQIEILNEVKSVYFLDSNLYFYRVNNNQSLTHKFDIDNVNKNIIMCEKIINVFKEKKLNNVDLNMLNFSVKRFLLSRLRTAIIKAITFYEESKNKKEINNIIKQYIDNKYIRKIIKEYPIIIKNKEQSLFNIFIRIRGYKMLYLLVKIKNKVRKKNRF